MLLLNWFYCLSNPTCTEKDNTRIDDNIIYGTQIWRVCFCYRIYRPLWYIYWHGFTWIQIIQNIRCQFYKLTQFLIERLFYWASCILLFCKSISMWTYQIRLTFFQKPPGSFLKKLIHILKSYCDWADLSTLLFDLLCSLRFLYKMYFRWKVLKFTSITKTFH